MPWNISESEGKYCVYKEGESEPLHCYETEAEAKDYLAALYASEKSAKLGARTNIDDRGRVRAIRKLATEIQDHTKAIEPNDEDKPKDILNLTKPIKSELEALFIALPDIPGAVKAVGDWELDVLGVPFGGPVNGKDSDGEYFSPNTEIYKDFFKTIPVFYYHGINPDGKTAQKDPVLIGTAQYSRTDKRGHWYRVTLNKAVAFAKRMWEAAKQGIARASSGSLSHLVRIEKGGEIKNWAVAELSLIDAEGKRQPANAWAVASPVMKAMYDQANMELPAIDPPGRQGAENAQKPDGTETATVEPIQKGDVKMDEIDVKKIAEEAAAAAVKAEREAVSAAQAKAAEEKAKFDKAVEDAVKAKTDEYVKAGRLPFADGAPAVTKFADTNKYDGLDAGEQAVLVATLQSAKKDINPAAFKALALKLEEDKTPVGEDGRRAMKAAGIKADEVNYSTSSTYGSYWVGAAYSRSLWEAIRVGTFVVGKLPQVEVPEGMSSIYLPLQSTDPTWYEVAEVTSLPSSAPESTITSSTLGTSQVQLTLAKLGARVMWSGELEEDSLIPFASQLRNQLAVSGAEYLESAIIDGHTSTTSLVNINKITGAAPVDGQYYLVWNGFRVSPLVTTSTNSRAGGSLTVEDYIETVKLMGGGGINGLDRTKVGFIVDPNTYYKTMALPELLTRDVYASPTIEGGKLTSLWGYELTCSGSMHKMQSSRKTNSAGKIELTTDANNIYGAILAVRWDQWMFGWKRRMTIETTRIANADATEIVAMMRCGLIQRDTEASAITYGVSV